ncbi:CotH kinase family protein [Chloroflexota bacterium]
MQQQAIRTVIFSILLVIVLITGGTGCSYNNGVATAADDNRPFYNDRVVTVRIVMSEDDWKFSRKNALAEQYVKADMWFDGEPIPDVAVRPKGNSSLKLMAMESSSIKYSFKVDLNFFNSARNLYGIKKLCFNNGWSDPTIMREVLAYEIYEQMDIPTPRTSHVDLWINDTHLGLYIMVEAIDKTFIDRHFADGNGNLYKPEMPAAYLDWTEEEYAKRQAQSGNTRPDAETDEMNVNLGGGNLTDIMKALEPKKADVKLTPAQRFPGGPGGPGGPGAARGDLVQQMGLKTNENKPDHSLLFRLLDVINNEPDETFPAEIEKVLDVDEALRFLAVSALMVHLDNYIAMGHNYYLYEDGDKFTILPWDLNMAFGTFNFSLDRDQLINYYIDEPSGGAMAERPLIMRLLSHKPYLDKYHGYLRELLNGPFAAKRLNSHIDEIAKMIRPYVEADEHKFYTTEQFKQSLVKDISQSRGRGMPSPIGLKSFIAERSKSVRQQLAGKRESGPGDGSGNGGHFGFGPPSGAVQPRQVVDPETAPYVPDITPEDAVDHVGKKTTACGPVVGTQIIAMAPHRPHILDLGTPNKYAVEIAEADVANFPGDPIEIYKDKIICVTGVIAMTPFGDAILVVNNPSQIVIKGTADNN